MDYQFIKVDHDDQVMILTINRPDVHNALSPAVSHEMAHAFDAYEADDNLRVAIVTGAGDIAFSAGGDISVMEKAKVDDDYILPESGYGGLTSRTRCNKPIIAAVNGMAFGGGFEVALACDLIICSERASFGLPEPLIGVAAVAGGMHRLVRQIGLKPAMGILLTADAIDAQKALSLGLVNEVTPHAELLDVARRYAAKICRCAPLSIEATKHVTMQGLNYSNLEELLQAQSDGVFEPLTAMFQSEDTQEGLKAFTEKRKPVWKRQ